MLLGQKFSRVSSKPSRLSYRKRSLSQFRTTFFNQMSNTNFLSLVNIPFLTLPLLTVTALDCYCILPCVLRKRHLMTLSLNWMIHNSILTHTGYRKVCTLTKCKNMSLFTVSKLQYDHTLPQSLAFLPFNLLTQTGLVVNN